MAKKGSLYNDIDTSEREHQSSVRRNVFVKILFRNERKNEGSEEDNSAASHLAIGQVALAVALDNWLLGIGRENFEQVSRAYESVTGTASGSRSQLTKEPSSRTASRSCSVVIRLTRRGYIQSGYIGWAP